MAKEDEERNKTRQALFAAHFVPLLQSILEEDGGQQSMDTTGDDDVTAAAETAPPAGQEAWTVGSPQMAAFDVLLRAAPLAVSQNMGRVVPVFRAHLHDPERDPEVRLRLLALLQSVLACPQVGASALAPHGKALVMCVLMPNAVWKAGMVASTIRKVTMACLYTLLSKGKLEVQALYETAALMLPVLKTNLEDYDASTRQLTCSVLGLLFALLPGALGEDPVRQLYPELLKRLDDSNDTVRLAICDTLRHFFVATPVENLRGTILEYSTDQLLIHLDDPEEGMQAKALSVLEVLAKLDPVPVGKRVRAARSSHRSPGLCDRLTAVVEVASATAVGRTAAAVGDTATAAAEKEGAAATAGGGGGASPTLAPASGPMES